MTSATAKHPIPLAQSDGIVDPHMVEDLDTKELAPHVEHLDKQDVGGNVPVSAFAHLDFRQTLRLFWKSFMFAMMALFLACSDGFQFQLPGNLIAQTSFIRQSRPDYHDGSVLTSCRAIWDCSDCNWSCPRCPACWSLGRCLFRYVFNPALKLERGWR